MSLDVLFRASPAYLVLSSAWFWVIFFSYLSGLSGAARAATFLFGFCMYTLNEYFIHAVLFHLVAKHWPPSVPPPNLYYKAHGRHHVYPDEADRVLLPVAHQWVLVAVLTSIWHVALLPFGGGFAVTAGVGSGLMFGYSFYEIAHLFAHGGFQYLEFLNPGSDFHLVHHKVTSKKNFGFVSPVWDYVFGTIADHEDLNPFAASKKGAAPPGGDGGVWRLLASLPLPIPFFHWFCMFKIRQLTGGGKTIFQRKVLSREEQKKKVIDQHLY
jgi:sterol desaturase/sphingolipid hydroxylase (fatty acid hydroxylase superfamily)